MAYAEELLALARHLAHLERTNSRQASLRRAVSTAYYALFHLLISEATLNWRRPDLRPEIGRLFGHGRMKNASKKSELAILFKTNPPPDQETDVSKHLHAVASTFIQVQQSREEADYDTGKEWTETDVDAQIDAVTTAFESWRTIRDEPIAQAYLVSLLGKRQRAE